MSIAIDKQEFEHGLALMHDRLVDAINAYADYLHTFGTCPNMEIAINLRRQADSILIHDGADATPFRHATKKED